MRAEQDRTAQIFRRILPSALRMAVLVMAIGISMVAIPVTRSQAQVCSPPACPANAAWDIPSATCICNAGYSPVGLLPPFGGAGTCVLVPPVVNGICGAANGVAVAAAPAAGLCTTGTATAVAGAGPWTWSCNGSGGGSNAACSAPAAAPSYIGQISYTWLYFGTMLPAYMVISPSTGDLCQFVPFMTWTTHARFSGCDYRVSGGTTCTSFSPGWWDGGAFLFPAPESVSYTVNGAGAVRNEIYWDQNYGWSTAAAMDIAYGFPLGSWLVAACP